MIKAIIFDCFGVLMSIDHVQKFSHDFATTPEIRQRFDELHREVDLGLINRQEFINELSRISGVAERKIQEDFYKKPPANHELLQYIRDELKPKYKVGMLSNVGREGVSSNFTPEDLELFEQLVLSSEVGMAKPDPKIFELACERLNVKPAEAVMIDDLESNCRGAEQAGLKAIQFLSYQQCREALKQIL